MVIVVFDPREKNTVRTVIQVPDEFADRAREAIAGALMDDPTLADDPDGLVAELPSKMKAEVAWYETVEVDGEGDPAGDVDDEE